MSSSSILNQSISNQCAGCFPETCAKPTDWALLLSWVLWVHCGYESLGSLAGQLREPKKTFTRGVAILIPFAVASMVLPMIASLNIDSNRNHYRAGYMNDLAAEGSGGRLTTACSDTVMGNLCYPRLVPHGQIQGQMPNTQGLMEISASGNLSLNLNGTLSQTAPYFFFAADVWMFWFFFLGAVVANIGLYNSQTLTADIGLDYLFSHNIARKPQAELQQHKEVEEAKEEGPRSPRARNERFEFSISKKNSAQPPSISHTVIRWLMSSPEVSGPSRGVVITNGLLVIVLGVFPYEILLELMTGVSALTYVLFFSSFIVFRFRNPDLARPFMIPVGNVGAVLICIPPMMLILAGFYMSVLTNSKPYLGIDYFQLYALVITLGIGLAIQYFWNKCRQSRRMFKRGLNKLTRDTGANSRLEMV